MVIITYLIKLHCMNEGRIKIYGHCAATMAIEVAQIQNPSGYGVIIYCTRKEVK